MIRGICIAAAVCLALGPAAAHAAGGESGDRAVFSVSETYIALDSLTAMMARDGRMRATLQIDAGLEIRDPALRARANALRPRLRDAYAAALAEYIGSEHRPGAAPDAGRIGDMLQQATDRTLGQTGADLLLGTVILH